MTLRSKCTCACLLVDVLCYCLCTTCVLWVIAYAVTHVSAQDCLLDNAVLASGSPCTVQRLLSMCANTCTSMSGVHMLSLLSAAQMQNADVMHCLSFAVLRRNDTPHSNTTILCTLQHVYPNTAAIAHCVRHFQCLHPHGLYRGQPHQCTTLCACRAHGSLQASFYSGHTS